VGQKRLEKESIVVFDIDDEYGEIIVLKIDLRSKIYKKH